MEYTLDPDAMQIEGEKREARYTYQNVKGYMPMLGFLFETPVCLYEEFREGNVAPQAGQVAFYRECQARIPLGKRIAFYRADSASYQGDLINVLEADGVCWAITADQDKAVKTLIDRKLLTQRGRGLYKKRGRTVEPVCGQIKDCRGIRKFMRRGLEACAQEWKLICATHNLLKLWRSGKGIAAQMAT